MTTLRTGEQIERQRYYMYAETCCEFTGKHALDTHSKDKLARHTEHNTCPLHCNVVQACTSMFYTRLSLRHRGY